MIRVPGYCPLCVSRRGSIAVVEDGRFVALEPDPSHPTGQALCAKGRAAPELVDESVGMRHNGRRQPDSTRPRAPRVQNLVRVEEPEVPGSYVDPHGFTVSERELHREHLVHGAQQLAGVTGLKVVPGMERRGTTVVPEGVAGST